MRPKLTRPFLFAILKLMAITMKDFIITDTGEGFVSISNHPLTLNRPGLLESSTAGGGGFRPPV